MNKKRKIILVGLILLLATFLRFYRLYETAPFLGDQGRDLWEIREALLAHQIPLVGPPTSLNFRTGPAHYYLLLPSLLVANYQPLGPILFSTFLGVIVTGLIFFLSLNLFSFWPALISSLAHATSPLLIGQTRGFWNPIDIPLFYALIFLCLYQLQKNGKIRWFLALGFLAGITAQLHPSTFPTILFILFWWLYFFFQKVPKSKRSSVLKWSTGALFTFWLLLLPYLVFQVQNNFGDLKTLWSTLLESQIASGDKKLLSLFFQLLDDQFRLLLPIPFLSLAIIILPFFWKKGRNLFWHCLFSFWLLGSLLLLALFPGPIPIHYTTSLWILPFLLLASCLKTVKKQKIVFLIGFILIVSNLANYTKVLKPTNDLARVEKISQMILEKSAGQPLAILLISDRSASDTHFRYFLKIKGANVLSLKEKDIPHLFLICIEPDCPTTQEVQNFKVVESECLPWCPSLQEEKEIDLAQWRFVSAQPIFDSQIYLFQNPEFPSL